HVTGMFYAPEKILRHFEFSEEERPIIAQIFGSNPDDFYRAAQVVCKLGFDGVDINMGCPSKTVTKNCGGAKLITEPKLAQEIVRATQQGVKDWAGNNPPIPVSVKTRVGYDSIVIEKWIEILLGEKPAVISLHGRTLKQMYKGEADWNAIARAVKVAEKEETLIFGNGDVHSVQKARERIEETGVDGVLIGRAAIGNPWIFREREPSPEERIQVALEHATIFEERHPERDFRTLRKHLSSYLRNFPNASILRQRALQVNNVAELAACLNETVSDRQTDPANPSPLLIS
ncbi:MAG: tRNA-dihydrouridine synthase, partial [bacterium]|nr:tRNA-dihydrouridine synthase [bacterium]